MDGCRIKKSFLSVITLLFIYSIPNSFAENNAESLESALSEINDELKQSPTNYEKRLVKIDLLLKSKRWNEAQAEISTANRLRSNPSEIKKREVLLNIGQQKFSLAKDLLLQDYRQGRLTEEEELLFLDVLMEVKDFPLAYQVANHASEKYLPSAKVLKFIGVSAKELGKKNEAEIAFRKSLQMEPKDAALWIEYAKFLIQFQKKEEAIGAIKNGMYLNKNSVDFLKNAAELADKINESAIALDAYKAIVAIEPGNDFALKSLAKSYEKSGRLDQMGELLGTVVKANPEKTWAVLSYANLLDAIGERELSKKVVEDAIKLNPTDEKLVYFRDGRIENPKQNVVNEEVKKVQEPIAAARTLSSAQNTKETSDPIAKEPSHQKSFEYYIVEEGDYLGSISFKFFGTSKKWRSILNENKDLLKDPASLAPGMKIKIPTKPSAKLEELKNTDNFNVASSSLFVSDVIFSKASAPEKKVTKNESSLMVDPESIQLPQVIPTEKNKTIDSSSKSVESEIETPISKIDSPKHRSLWDKWYALAVYGMAISEKYQLEGAGFNANLPNKMGFGYGLSAALRSEDASSEFSLNASAAKISYDSLSGLSPSAIDVNRKMLGLGWKNYFLFHHLPVGSAFERAWIRASYVMKWRDVVETNPRPVVTELQTRGPELAMGLDRMIDLFGKMFSWETSISIFFPNSYKEPKTITGYLTSSSTMGIQSALSHKIMQDFSLAYGISLQREVANFSGTGSRGVSNARETNWIIHLPVELRY